MIRRPTFEFSVPEGVRWNDGLASTFDAGSKMATTMTQEELNTMLATLTDDDLALRLKTAAADLQQAAEEEHESEWHEACFAATIVYCQESDRRKRLCAGERVIGNIRRLCTMQRLKSLRHKHQ